MIAIRFETSQAAMTRRRAGRRRAGAIARLLLRFRSWRRRAKDRAQLAALDNRMLADIGLTSAEAEILSQKPFWRA
jgi:uncharacterized protein YjiS (DUF1127 family)